MKYSIWSNYLIRTEPEEMVVTLARKGWHYSELSTEHGEQLLGRGDPANTGAEFKKFADRYGVKFPQGHLWLQVDIACEKQAEMVDILKRWIDLYYAAGVKNCVLHAGGREMRNNGCTAEEINKANARALKILCDYIGDRDIRICIENMAGGYKTAVEIKELISMVNSPKMAICLDTGHLNMCGFSQSEFIAEAGSLLKAVHITDNEGKSDQHLIPYARGRVDWEDFITALAKSPYEGLLNFEIPGETISCPYELILAKLDYVREVASYMISKIDNIRNCKI